MGLSHQNICFCDVYKNISISVMRVLLISAFASTAEKPCLLSSSPPSSLFVPTGPFCVHGICITSRIQNISSYSHPDELSSKPKCPNKTTILEWLFVNFNREQTQRPISYTSYISCCCILIQNIYKADILHFDFKYQHRSEKIDRKIKQHKQV